MGVMGMDDIGAGGDEGAERLLPLGRRPRTHLAAAVDGDDDAVGGGAEVGDAREEVLGKRSGAGGVGLGVAELAFAGTEEAEAESVVEEDFRSAGGGEGGAGAEGGDALMRAGGEVGGETGSAEVEEVVFGEIEGEAREGGEEGERVAGSARRAGPALGRGGSEAGQRGVSR